MRKRLEGKELGTELCGLTLEPKSFMKKRGSLSRAEELKKKRYIYYTIQLEIEGPFACESGYSWAMRQILGDQNFSEGERSLNGGHATGCQQKFCQML